MKRIAILSCLSLALLNVGLWASAAYAGDFRTGQSIAVGRDEAIDSSLYAAGSTITIAGTVHGDVFCAGQTVTISGTVEGDVLCAGQTVDIAGAVHGDVRAAGQTVKLAATIDGSATIAGQSVVFAEGAMVERDASAFGETIQLLGAVKRDALAMGDTVQLMNTVGRNAKFGGTSITLGAGARIGGNLTYMSDRAADIAQQAVVSGRTERQDLPKEFRPKSSADRFAASLMGAGYWFAAIALLGLLALAFAPKALQAASERIRQRPLATLASGFGVLLLTPLAAALAAVTVIGLPLAIFIMLVYVALLIVSSVVAASCFGNWLVGKLGWSKLRPAAALLIGLGLLAILSIVPLIGWLVPLGAMIWGLGGIIAGTRTQRMPRGKEEASAEI